MRSLVVELPRHESEEARARRGFDAIDQLRAEAREARRRVAPGRFFLPDSSFRVMIALLASVTGSPLGPELARDLLEGLLRSRPPRRGWRRR